VEQRPSRSVAAKHLRDLCIEAQERRKAEFMLSGETHAVRVGAMVNGRPVLVFGTVFTAVFVSVLALSALRVLHRFGRRLMVDRAVALFTDNRLGGGHPIAYEKNESEERTPTHQCNTGSRKLPPLFKASTVPGHWQHQAACPFGGCPNAPKVSETKNIATLEAQPHWKCGVLPADAHVPSGARSFGLAANHT